MDQRDRDQRGGNGHRLHRAVGRGGSPGLRRAPRVGVEGAILNEFSIDPWVAVLDLGDGTVLAFEANGWQGSTGPTLRRAASAGRAASVFWNVNAVQQLSFAENGAVLSSTRDYGWLPVSPGSAAVAEAIVDLDFSDWETRRERGLRAVGRFTGRQVGPAEILARKSQLEPNTDVTAWEMLHDTANPDPFSAVLAMWPGARIVLGTSAADLLRSACSEVST